MKSILTLILLISLNVNAKELLIPKGVFSCQIDYTEEYELVINSGEDFPYLSQRFDPPLQKSEKLLLEFGATEELSLYVLNPEVLPNWLLVTPKFYEDQSSFAYIRSEGNAISYQVNWNHTWYFGSGIDIETRAFDGRTLKIDLTFNDNDSVGETHRWVKCKKSEL